MNLTLSKLAFIAASKAHAEIYARAEAADNPDAEGEALREAIETYIITAQAGDDPHELSIIPGGVPGYETLAAVLRLAYEQSAKGKGRERHNKNSLPFNQQPILALARMVGLGYPVGQAMKKSQEAVTMAERGNAAGASAEFLGAIVYLAAAHIALNEHRQLKD